MKRILPEMGRVLNHAWRFYRERMKLLMVFAIPFIFAALIPIFVPSPTYLALGGVFIRGGSIPTMTTMDWVLTGIAYLAAIFIIADTVVNITLIIKSKRTLTSISSEVVHALGKYATKVFVVSIIASLVLYALFLALYDMPLQSIFYPLLSLIITVLFFLFSPQAIVIDDLDPLESLRAAYNVTTRKPLYTAMWLVLSFIFTFLSALIGYIFPSFLTQFVILILNSVIVLPFLLVLAAQIYMEKYPLAR
jgi:hypothetical protein